MFISGPSCGELEAAETVQWKFIHSVGEVIILSWILMIDPEGQGRAGIQTSGDCKYIFLSLSKF